MKNAREPQEHQQWYYHPDFGAHVFEIGETAPEDWYETPDDFPDSAADEPKTTAELRALGKESVLALAQNKGIEVDPEAHFFTIVAAVKKGLGL